MRWFVPSRGIARVLVMEPTTLHETLGKILAGVVAVVEISPGATVLIRVERKEMRRGFGCWCAGQRD